MADKWIVKPAGGNKIEVTVPDGVTIEDLDEIQIEQLQEAISKWQQDQLQARVGEGFCIGGCGVQT